MGSTYSGLQLGDELLDSILTAQGVERDVKHDYALKDSPNGLRVIEYDGDGDGEVVDSYLYNTPEVVDMSYFEDVKKDILKTRDKTNKLKYYRYTAIAALVLLFVIAIIIVLVGKGVF